MAAALLGLATYSKPFPNGLMVAPLVLAAWWRREWTRGFMLGAVAVAVAALSFAFNLAVTGEFNYQGGDRQTFYGSFPFDGSGDVWNRQASQVMTDGSVQAEVVDGRRVADSIRPQRQVLPGRSPFRIHPVFFPGRGGDRGVAVFECAAGCVASLDIPDVCGVRRGDAARVALHLERWGRPDGEPLSAGHLSGAAVSDAAQATSPWAASPAWLGGALFTAKILMNPFIAAKYPYLMTERGAARRLPVELSMVTDLPVMVAGPTRARIPYGHNPTMQLFFLDQNSFPPEPPGMWVAGGRRTDIIVRTDDRLDHLAVEAESPIATVLTMSMGAEPVTVPLVPGKLSRFNVPARGVLYERYGRTHAYLLSASSSEGFVPVLRDPTAPARDYRNLGALLRFAAVPAPVAQGR